MSWPKSLFRCFLTVLIAGLIALLIQTFLFPLVYKIKEPNFEIPIECGRIVERAEDLPIRNDIYGDGHFGAERKNKRIHKGLDLAAEIKSPVYASKSGWAKTYYFPAGYGNLVIINHPGGWQTRYGHLHEITIKKFQWIRQGDIIGTVGKTGNADLRSIIAHLHFEIRYEDKPVDPAVYLVKRR